MVSCTSMRASEPKPTNHREPREIQRGLPARRRKRSSESFPAAAPAEHQDRAAGSHEGRKSKRSAARATDPIPGVPATVQARKQAWPAWTAAERRFSDLGCATKPTGKSDWTRMKPPRVPGICSTRSWHRLPKDFSCGVWSGSPARRSAGVPHRECGRRRAGNSWKCSGAGH